MHLDERLVPAELIVGTSGNLCFFTYKENDKINSEHSWSSWSDNSDNPIILKNEFKRGYKISGLNHRWSSRSRNKDILLVKHPDIEESFELPMSQFLEILEECDIVDKEFTIELIINKNRSLITKKMYDKALKIVNEEEEKENEKLNLFETRRIKPKEQVPGKIYVDKSGYKVLFLGSCDMLSGIDGTFGKKRFCYIDLWSGDKLQPKENGLPSFIYEFGNGLRVKNIRSTVNKLKLAECDETTESYYKYYTDDDFEKIKIAFQKFDGLYGGNILNGTKERPIPRFKEDYDKFL